MVINPPPSLGALTFGQWTANLAGFNGTIAASTGTGPAILTVIGGALPTGLTASLSGDAITFAGDPTIAGTYSFTLKLTDSLGVFACRSYTIVIDPAKTLVWTGRGSNDLWNDAANWSGAVPVAGDTLIFGAGCLQMASVNNFAANTTFASIVFQDSGYSLTGNAIKLSAALTRPAQLSVTTASL